MKWRDFSYEIWKEQNAAFDHQGFDAVVQTIFEKTDSMEGFLEATKDMERPPWKPNAFYNRDGDQIEIYLSDEDCYAHWLCPGVVVHLSHDTEEVVGVTIEGIKRMVQHKDHKIAVEAWDGADHVVTVDGAPVGQVRSKKECEMIAAWLETAKEELWTSKSLQETCSKPQSDTSATNATPSPTEPPT